MFLVLRAAVGRGLPSYLPARVLAWKRRLVMFMEHLRLGCWLTSSSFFRNLNSQQTFLSKHDQLGQ